MSVLDTLEICFTANLDGVTAQLDDLSARLKGLDSAAMASAGAMGSAGAMLAEGLKSGLASGVSGVFQQAQQLGGQAAEAAGSAKSGMLAQGMAMTEMFRTGILSGGAGAGAAAGSVARMAKFSGGEASARSSGLALSSGFASGIRSGSSAVNAAVSSIVNAATKKIRSLLSIHSPSKVTRGFGEYFGEGFAQGIGGSVSMAAQAADALGSAAVGGLSAAALPKMETGSEGMARLVQTAVNDALGDVRLTIPLNVDGMKLGEASIRGINAVTRSAGRVLLNI